MKTITKLTIGSLALVFISACSNNFGGKFNLKNLGGIFNDEEDADFIISNVAVSTGEGQSGTGAVTTLFFDSERSKGPITTNCALSTNNALNGRACACRFEWTELNVASGSTVSIPHTVITRLESLTNFQASCEAPALYVTEIPKGTNLKISLVPVTGEDFSSNAYDHIKGVSSNENVDFAASFGIGFSNIVRYSCFELQERGTEVISGFETVTTSDQQELRFPSATKFCISGKSSEGCQGLRGPRKSAQSYPYNLYIQSDRAGNINESNERYICPRVLEDLAGSGVPNFWPLDSNFALAKEWSSETPIGIEADSVLFTPDQGNQSDPEACKDLSGNDRTSTPGQPNTISRKCVGYAFRPNPNGTCPSFKDSTGKTRNTFRLRRYYYIYPNHFHADGTVIEQPHGLDEIYVVDRPVKSADPANPYTMRGPKPCNFAWVDHTGTLEQGSIEDQRLYSVDGTQKARDWGGVPTYVGANDPIWDAVNIDGIKFPNVDSGIHNSCSSMLPIVEYSTAGGPNRLYLGTTMGMRNIAGDRTHTNEAVINLGSGRTIPMSKVYVRGVTPVSPFYAEDTSFEACAPLSDPFREPPLHFAKDAEGNMGWCAEAYPSQNLQVQEIDRKHVGIEASTEIPGKFQNFTSHVVKDSVSAACNATDIGAFLPQGYPADGRANHNSQAPYDFDSSGTSILDARTCDRTINTAGLDNAADAARAPLLAPADSVERLLTVDPSYRCSITFDDGNGKVGRNPASGCCDPNIINIPNNSGAHLEPGNRCLAPNY